MTNPVLRSLLRSTAVAGGLIVSAILICVIYLELSPARTAGFAERLSECHQRLQAHDALGARQELLRLHGEDESHPDVLEMLGHAALQQGNLDEAIEWFERVPESLRERAAAARFLAAQLAMQRGLARRTEALALEALRLDPRLTEPHRLLIRYYLIVFQHRQLREQTALLDAKGQVSVMDLMMRSVAHRAVWEDDEHVSWLEQCLREDPSHTTIRAALARYYSQDDRTADARRVLADAPRGDGEYWRIQLAQAELEIIAGEYERALSLLEGFPAQAETESRVWLARGKVWSELGHSAAALTAFENAIRLDPCDPAATYAVARLRDAQGAKPAADALYERSQKQKHLLTLMERVMRASNPAHHPVEPVANTIRSAAATFAGLQLYREAAILADSLGDTTLDLPAPARQKTLSAPRIDELAAVRNVPAAPSAARTGTLAPPPGSTPPHAAIRFADVASRIGLAFEYHTGRSPYRWMMETLGGGVGVLDYDLDGWDDLFLTQAGSLPVAASKDDMRDRLFRNINGSEARDVTAEARLFDHAYGQGCAVGDYDNDGFSDVVVCNFGEVLVLRNQGDGTFENVSRVSGVASSRWSTSAAFSDIDRDGDLDLYIAQYLDVDFEKLKPCTSQGKYVSCHPFDYYGEQDLFFENAGNGSFVDRTAAVGLVAANGKGLGVAVADFARQGRESIFVANDTTPNFLFVRDPAAKELRLREEGLASGAGVGSEGLPKASMGVAMGDVDRDGHFDLFVTAFQGETNTLFRCLAEGEFVDGTERAGLGASSRDRMGWGCQFLDADCNGDLDLFVVNGQLHEVRQLPHFYYNQGAGRFREITSSAGSYFSEPRLGRSVALIDWNRDLLMDLAATYQEGNISLLENQSQAGNRLVLQFVGRESNRDAVGTIVQARTGDKSSWMYVTRSGGYFAANDPKVLVGCGQAGQVDALEVTWPTGRVESWRDIPVGHTYLVVEGTGRLLPRDKP